MRQYLDLMQLIMTNGNQKGDRTGTGTKSVFGHMMRFDLAEGFPLLTTKKVFTKGIIHELLWFLMGDTNVKYLNEHGVTIWNEWAFVPYLNKVGIPVPKQNSEEWKTLMAEFVDKILHVPGFTEKYGDLGPVYGKQWCEWEKFTYTPGFTEGGDLFDSSYAKETINQIAEVVARIKAKPNDRRLIVTAWNPADIDKVALPWCHCFFQFYVSNNKLSCMLYQRSCDTFLGVPFNIASYALLTMMIAQVCDLEPGEFIWTGGDVHLYSNHMEQVKLQLSREPRALPTMKINPDVKDIFSFKYEDFTLEGYDPHPAIKAPVAV